MMSTQQKWGESRCFFSLLFFSCKCFFGGNREKKKVRHTQTHARCSETRPRRKRLSASGRWWWWSQRRRLFFYTFFVRNNNDTTTESSRFVFSRRSFASQERDKKKNGILGNDVRVRRPRRRVRGVHQRHGHSRREPPETRALDNGGDVHVDDVGDNIHGANAPVSATGDEQKRGVETQKDEIESRK